ncbi:MAG: NAD-dependent epimerase/dehydratase family protein [Candidatus Pacearchaeota archaeon]
MKIKEIKTVLVTGAGGLIGSEASKYFCELGCKVIGIDNNMRKKFFGEGGDVSKVIFSLTKEYSNFENFWIDIRNKRCIENIIIQKQPDVIIHTAAQPSHDWAAREPITDFTINANGILILLEAFRKYIKNPEKVFIHMSTNKVYGDNPNKANLIEKEKRYEYSENQEMKGISLEGISEEMSLDNCVHSLFGVSKCAADLLAQEYGKYFNLNVGIFRGGCLTGPQHSAVELHGYLAYIINCAVNKKLYKIFGYKGKQVRDQIHSADVISAFVEFIKNPKKGEAYNLGGCKQNSISILETIDILEKDFGLKLNYEYIDKNRVGDHICYYSDMSKFKKDYPNWKISRNVYQIIEEIIKAKKK